jgi:hypothetical protein
MVKWNFHKDTTTCLGATMKLSYLYAGSNQSRLRSLLEAASDNLDEIQQMLDYYNDPANTERMDRKTVSGIIAQLTGRLEAGQGRQGQRPIAPHVDKQVAVQRWGLTPRNELAVYYFDADRGGRPTGRKQVAIARGFNVLRSGTDALMTTSTGQTFHVKLAKPEQLKALIKAYRTKGRAVAHDQLSGQS